jgi:hypothetical protein
MAFLWHGNVWTAKRSRKFRGSCSIANGQPTSAALNRGTRVPRGKQFRKVSKIDHTSGIGESILLHHRRVVLYAGQTKPRATGLCLQFSYDIDGDRAQHARKFACIQCKQ